MVRWESCARRPRAALVCSASGASEGRVRGRGAVRRFTYSPITGRRLSGDTRAPAEETACPTYPQSHTRVFARCAIRA